MARRSIYEQITDMVREQSQADGQPAFRRGWDADAVGMPMNIDTGSRYSGVNRLTTLTNILSGGGERSRWFITLNQLKKIRRQQRKKGVPKEQQARIPEPSKTCVKMIRFIPHGEDEESQRKKQAAAAFGVDDQARSSEQEAEHEERSSAEAALDAFGSEDRANDPAEQKNHPFGGDPAAAKRSDGQRENRRGHLDTYLVHNVADVENFPEEIIERAEKRFARQGGDPDMVLNALLGALQEEYGLEVVRTRDAAQLGGSAERNQVVLPEQDLFESKRLYQSSVVHALAEWRVEQLGDVTERKSIDPEERDCLARELGTMFSCHALGLGYDPDAVAGILNGKALDTALRKDRNLLPRAAKDAERVVNALINDELMRRHLERAVTEAPASPEVSAEHTSANPFADGATGESPAQSSNEKPFGHVVTEQAFDFTGARIAFISETGQRTEGMVRQVVDGGGTLEVWPQGQDRVVQIPAHQAKVLSGPPKDKESAAQFAAEMLDRIRSRVDRNAESFLPEEEPDPAPSTRSARRSTRTMEDPFA